MKTISIGQWAFKTNIKVEDAVLDCRNLKSKARAEQRLGQFLVHNFGEVEERTAMIGSAVPDLPDWAVTQAAVLLDYDRKSANGWTAGLFAMAFRQPGRGLGRAVAA